MIATAVLVMVAVGAALLTAAGALTVLRISKGPTSLDRVVAADVLVAVVIAALALEAIRNDHATTLPVMLVLALLGFTSAVSVARLVADRDKAIRWDIRTGRTDGADPADQEHDEEDDR